MLRTSKSYILLQAAVNFSSCINVIRHFEILSISVFYAGKIKDDENLLSSRRTWRSFHRLTS